MENINIELLSSLPTLLVPEDCWHCYKLKIGEHQGSKISFYCLGDTPCLLSKDFFISNFFLVAKNEIIY